MSSVPSPPRFPVSRKTLFLLVLGLTALLAIVAIASRGERPKGGEESRPIGLPSVVMDYILTAYLVFMVLGGVLLMYVLFQGRLRARAQRPSSNLRRTVLTLVFVAAFSFAAVSLARRIAEDDDRLPLAEQPGGGRAGGKDDDDPAYEPRFRWAAAAGVLGILTAGAAFFLIAARRSQTTHPTAASALADVLEDTLDDLRNEQDPRRAVIAAYARMETALAAHGFPRRPAEAPLEFLGRILLELRVRAVAVFDLTELFERAKFSRHEIDHSMKDEAIAALIAVRDDLRAPAPA